MRARLLACLFGAVLLGGCAVPSWVPLIGSPRGEEETAADESPGAKRPARRRAARDVARPSASATAAAPRPADNEDGVADRIVAVVNNDAITLAEIQESIAMFRREERERTRVSDQELSQRFLNQLIDSRLQLQEADREKITVDDAEVDEDLAERMKKLGATKPEDYEGIVRAQGVTLEAVKKRLRETLRVSRLVRRKVALRISVTDAEIDRYIEENRARLETGLTYHARHILLVPEGTSDAAWEAARIRADMIRTQLQGGADFAEMARMHSGDASAKDGGDLGTLTRGELASEIEEQILALQPGQISAPHRSSIGYHIFRLESKETLDGDRRERIRQQVREILFRQKYETRYTSWLKEVRQRAVIEIRM